MISATTAVGATGLLLPLPGAALPMGTPLPTAGTGPQDSIFVSPEARMLLAVASLLGSDQGAVPADRLLRLAASLGPVVLAGGGITPSIEVVQRGPSAADSALARVAAALRGEAEPAPPSDALPYFARVVSGEGNDAILLGDPAADADGQLSGVVDSGAGDDLLRLQGHILARPGTGDDQVEFASGSLLLSFRRGDGQDSVTMAGGTASLVLEDVAAADLDVSWSGLDLVLRIRNTNDSITLRNHDPANGGSVRTSDGVVSLADLVPAAPLNLTV